MSGSERQLLTSLIHVCCVSKILCMVPFVLKNGCTCIYVIVPEKRDLNEANIKIEIYPFSSSSQ